MNTTTATHKPDRKTVWAPDGNGGRMPVFEDTEPVTASSVIQEPDAPITLRCERCSEAFAAHEILGSRARFCDVCIDQIREERFQEEQERKDGQRLARRHARWAKICPPRFRIVGQDRDTVPQSTDVGHPEFNRDLLDRAMQSPLESGLGMVSPTGKCKTRVAWALLRRHHFDGEGVLGVSSVRFAEAVQTRIHDDDAASLLKRARSVDLLLIDDIGKSKMTDAVEAGLFGLIDHRYEHCLPIIWTANMSRPALETSMSDDRGAPLIRRLMEIGEPIAL